MSFFVFFVLFLFFRLMYISKHILFVFVHGQKHVYLKNAINVSHVAFLLIL